MKKICIKHVVMKLRNRQNVSNVYNCFMSKNVINKIFLRLKEHRTMLLLCKLNLYLFIFIKNVIICTI